MVAYATFGRRFRGFLLDTLLDLFVLLVLSAVGVGEWTLELWGAWLLIHHVGFVMEGGTLGHRMVGLRIVATNGLPIGPVHAVIRLVLKICSLLSLGLGFLWMLDQRERRTWHDLGADTIVVRELQSVNANAPDWAHSPPWRRPKEPTQSEQDDVGGHARRV